MIIYLSRLVSLLDRFLLVWSDWGFAAAWGVSVTSRQAGRHGFAVPSPAMRFNYRGRTDHTVLSNLFADIGYLDTRGGAPLRTIVDAGANIGIFSLLANRLWPDARIVALEIDDGNFEILAANASQIEGMTACKTALWSSVGDLHFVSGEGAQSHSVRAEGAGTGRTVSSTTLEQLARDHGLGTIDWLKLDIEGAEAEVVESFSPELWSRINAFSFECNDAEQSGSAVRVFHALPPGEFDAFAFGENVYFIRRSTGWSFRRRTRSPGSLPREKATTSAAARLFATIEEK